jgi:peptidoglycan-associated lipoprotein
LQALWLVPAAVFADTDPAADSAGAPLGQFQAEVAPVQQPPPAVPASATLPESPSPARTTGQGERSASGVDFPKVKTAQDEELAKRFAWWGETGAKPAPVKDPDRSGYWWWPEIPGEARPWGNQGYVYVRKIIFDYKTSEGEMKPSLVIKRIIKNVKVYFDYDKADLRDDAVDALNKALYTLEHNEKADILITGNCDARGSEKYNQKLGERRASSVEKYLLDKGLSADRIKILSQGKLNALAPTNDIVGMQQDRNAQFMVAEVEEVMIPAAKAHLFEDKVIEEKKVIEGEIRAEFKDYVIQPGDTLWSIAKREYGNGMQWKRIYEFNKDVISNPDRPKKGTKIRLPIE